MLENLLFIAGFFLLIKGAGILIKGSVNIAAKYNVSDIVIGLTIVSVGTSLPELIINLFASYEGNTSIAIGNIFGSNIANVFLILGLSAIFNPLPLKRNTIYSEIPFALIATLLAGFLANATFTTTKTTLIIDRIDGFIMLFFFGLFIMYILKVAANNKEEETVEKKASFSTQKSALLILLGVVMLYFGGEWVVGGATKIAAQMGLSEGLVGLSIVAIGTSLPELVTSVIAARKKSVDIAVGNIIGSNIFNLLWVLGLSAVINPLPFKVINNVDILVMVFAVVMIVIALAFSRQRRINRGSGVLFVLLYAAYMYYLFVRG